MSPAPLKSSQLGYFFRCNSSCSPSWTEIKFYFNYSVVLLVFKQSYFMAETAAVQKHMQISLFWVSINLSWVIAIISDELLASLSQYWGVWSLVSPLWMHCCGRWWYWSNCTRSSTNPVWILGLKWRVCFCDRANIIYLKIMFLSCYTGPALPSSQQAGDTEL